MSRLLLVTLCLVFFLLPRGAGPQAAPTQDARRAVLKLALAQLGKPYILGTEGPETFDCSGLVQWTYRNALGVETTRTTFTQLDALRPR